MRCGLLLPAASSPLQLDPVEPVLNAELSLDWPGRSVALTLSAVVDTGCPVDLVASTRLAEVLRESTLPARMETLSWGGRLETEVFDVSLKLGDWIRAEVHAPLEHFDECLLGLRALMKANLCLRGQDRSAYWAKLPVPGDSWDFIARDSDDEAWPAAPAKSRKKQRSRGAR